jgi:5-(carboxyamino)imidazole ribonucleotide synthase
MQDSDGFDGTLAAPGPTLGVVGGGQLGRMLGEAAGPLGVELVVSDPTPDCPARSVVRDQVVGDFDDYGTLRELGERADALTFEIELTDPDALAQVQEETGTPVHPAPETLRVIQDKYVQKEALTDRGIPVPAYRRVDGVEDLHAAGEDLGWPLMLKARRGGYDGRGNVPVAGPDGAEDALDAVAGPTMAEELLDFERELAVMGVRGAGERETFPVTETIHREEILRESVSPARADEAVRVRAREVADEVLDAMSGRGAFGIELFQVDPDEHGGEAILINEIAPRPHNSGHWTIEGCRTSQFENHLRAVLGWPLGSTERRAPTANANLLGDIGENRPAELRGVDTVLEADGAALHWYCKREARPLRKLGHVTLPGDPGDRVDDLLARVRRLRDATTLRPAETPE